LRDDALEDGFARRDAAAFERAYERFGSRMYTAALRVLRDRALAQECVHDVFLHLWRRGSGYTPARGNLEAFLVVCARNAALMRARDDARRRELVSSAPPAAQTAADPDPFEHESMHHAVSALPQEQSRIVELAYYRGMTHNEIASELHEPVGTVKSRLSSALRSLRAALGKEVNE
jgi:RNA polymerase sigma-70 factor, ECF subfamily